MLSRFLFIFIGLLTINGVFAQLPWTEDFESGAGSWTSISATECNNGSWNYFTVTDGTDMNGTYGSNTSNYFFATQNMDDTGCGNNTIEEITWDIDITSCSTGQLDFSILLAEDDNGWPSQGWDNNDYVHIYYSIDGGAEQNLLWIESDNSATETQAYIDTDFNGVGDGSLISDNFSTFTNTITGTGSTLTIRIEFGISESYVDLAIDDINITCSTPSNTISASTLSSLTYSVDCSSSTTDSGNIDFTSTGTFNSGNTYTVQLSDASGDFTNATDIGSSTSTGNSGNITFTIPSEISTGSGYRIRIVSSDPVATSSDNGSDITITQTGSCEPPHLSSVIINSCNASCTEGVNELVFGNTGDYSILVNESNFNFSYSNSGSLNNYTDNLTNNATVTQELNDECSSSNPFIDAYGTTIPPNSSWVLANDAICATDALVWSGLCNAGPIYVIYSTDSDWSSGGNFSNDPSNANPLRPYQTSMTTTSGETFTIDYETDGSQYPDNDGVFATFDVDGGPATAYGDNDCSFDPLVLPAELLNFNGFQLKGGNVLSWITASEYNTSHFTIERTTDGANWESLEDAAAAGYSSQELTYQITDTRFENNINIYRLRQVDHDGTEIIFSKYVTIDNRTDSDEQLIGIYNLMGQLIDKNHQGIQIHRYSDGTSVKIFKP